MAASILAITSTFLSISTSGQAFTPSNNADSFSQRPISSMGRHRQTRSPILFSSQLGNDSVDKREGAPSVSDSAFFRSVSTLDRVKGDYDDDHDDSSYTCEKKRILYMEKEIELLSQLDPNHPINYIDSHIEDDIQEHMTKMEEATLEELSALWHGQQGAINEHKLRFYESRLQDVQGSLDGPVALEHYGSCLDLIHEHCCVDSPGTAQSNGRLEEVDFDKLDLGKWIEPAHHLANLLAKTDRLAESKAWTEEILAEKPWHVGALSMMRIVCLRLNDEEAAMKWAVKGLPGLSPQSRTWRSEWVQESVDLAKEKLAELRKDLTDKIVAKIEISVRTTSSVMTEGMIVFDDSAWQ
eukprot:CAMPEP_0171354862 /NCGR_PEP_ID=MMETSP0878-20121228/44925_1 /TAXON_ID=67004 /ORGANISM="Thalassiosira weissflogii, Strain CCMP1336" /LENGTH=353 /DNA_ID=CAMNT_0011860851 /DNA_START=440 /DNA_END=1501 /DNA_ORIENTATION=-